MDKEISVFVADDQEFVVSGIIDLLSYAAGEIRVVGQASSPQETVSQVLQLQPDVVLFDMMYYKDVEGSLTAIKQIREGAPLTSILAMSAHDELLGPARKAGAHLAIHKDNLSPLAALKQRIKDAHLALKLPKPRQELAEALTPRELEVLQYLCEGLQNKEIARKLGISEKTVKHHIQEVYGKLGVGNRAEAVAFALKNGIC
jgi:NarL family two-component system response regulator LiaR